MKPEELEKMPLRVEKLFYELQNRVMADVVRRIEKTGRITSTADYQLEKVRIFGSSSEFIESEIKRLTGASDEAIWQLYEDAVDKDYTRNKSLYEQVNARFIPYDENEVMQSWVNAVVSQTKSEISNITQSMGFSISMGGNKKVFTPLSEYYQKYLDAACMDIVTGSFSYNTVLRRVVKEMTASGIRTVDYASGWSNRATVASRRAVMTGVNQLCGKINDRNAEQLKTDYFEVTAHANARPAHRSWQGQVYSRKQLAEVCGLGSVDGLEGANCRHQHLAFVPGISVRSYTDKQLADMARKEDIPKEWRGKSYKGYEATQEQRHMETIMRKQRADVKLLQQGKADAEEINAAKARYLNTLHQYQAFSRKMGLPEQMERVYMDGLGRIINARNGGVKAVEKPPGYGIIKGGNLYRKKKSTDHAEPMPKKHLQKIVKSFKRRGGIIQMDLATDEYLDMKKAEGITLNHNTILLHQSPSRSAVYEELIHSAQWRNGKNDGSLKSRLLCEIEAQEKLLKYSKTYGITEKEFEQTKKALDAYRKEYDILFRKEL